MNWHCGILLISVIFYFLFFRAAHGSSVNWHCRILLISVIFFFQSRSWLKCELALQKPAEQRANEDIEGEKQNTHTNAHIHIHPPPKLHTRTHTHKDNKNLAAAENFYTRQHTYPHTQHTHRHHEIHAAAGIFQTHGRGAEIHALSKNVPAAP